MFGLFKRKRRLATVFGKTFVVEHVACIEIECVPMSDGPVCFIKVWTTGGPIQIWRSDRPSNFEPVFNHPQNALDHALGVVYGTNWWKDMTCHT